MIPALIGTPVRLLLSIIRREPSFELEPILHSRVVIDAQGRHIEAEADLLTETTLDLFTQAYTAWEMTGPGQADKSSPGSVFGFVEERRDYQTPPDNMDYPFPTGEPHA